MFLGKLFQALAVACSVVVSTNAAAGQLQLVSNYGTNPTGVQMFVYRPANLLAKPALIVAIHACHGTAQDYFAGTQYANLADRYGFLVVYPDAPDPEGCWDVHTNATLTHNAGGDSLGIISQVRYAITNYGVDASRVYATGTSSGAMMTSVLAGAYPDVFQAGSTFAGVPYACFGGPDMWNTPCANGQLTKTGQQWGDLVRSGYPGYTGPRTRMQIFHGTLDQTLSYNNFNEEIKQWTNIFGYSGTPSRSTSNDPRSGWTRAVYGPNFQAISASGVDHNIPAQENDVLNWFGITGTTVPPTTTPTGTPTNTPPPPPPTTSTGGPGPQQTHWGQCGGQGWAGPTVCVAPYTCQAASQWYSQCL
ncbi:acetyl xylan esterase [Pluteus cervinus]|uniref:Acetyl xylan esterase n=1 Tax=Pluteus cervinus TaxID=181527 RepID=A0ACD3AX52_9AGAR|nr:acetyl xylan esterase [Pluteus cervinus]